MVLLTVDEASQRLGCSRQAVYQRAQRHGWPKVGKCYEVPDDVLDPAVAKPKPIVQQVLESLDGLHRRLEIIAEAFCSRLDGLQGRLDRAFPPQASSKHFMPRLPNGAPIIVAEPEHEPVCGAGAWLLSRREALGLSPAEAAKGFGLSLRAWNRYEKGERPIPWDVWLRIGGEEVAMTNAKTV